MSASELPWYMSGLPTHRLIREVVDWMRHGLPLTAADLEDEALAPLLTMLGCRDLFPGIRMHMILPKWAIALELMCRQPEAWFRDTPIVDRDRALLDAPPMPCFQLGPASYLKELVRPLECSSFYPNIQHYADVPYSLIRLLARTLR